ncbi:hypothetical protein ZIOFF_039098 [Zingiber officinale]|uniref:W2 domain-containing protein n=1 Tax=Zingiber officinale TaxID=94328 RepID=A0A8J5G6Q4_ZINOF|nr:hypothetical protein ZIOFF_039098 [Zingiber officinale]
MPKMITKREGRGNGIKTNVVNMVDIAKALHRPASYTIKYFGRELGAQSKFDDKTGTSLVNGAHDTAKLAGPLENFIRKYVQCYGCGNPETDIIITKTQLITLKCAACGLISDVNMRGKLTTFILKNLPEQKKSAKDKKAMRRAEKERLKEGDAADEEQKKLKKETKKKGPVSSNDKESLKRAVSKKKPKSSDEEHSSPPDTSAEAARQRIQEQLSATTAEMICCKASDLGPFLSSLSGPQQEIMEALFEATFEGVGKGFVKEVDKKKNYLVAAVESEESQTCLRLCGIVTFCEKSSGDSVTEVVLVAKCLYNLDILEEECHYMEEHETFRRVAREC